VDRVGVGFQEHPVLRLGRLLLLPQLGQERLALRTALVTPGPAVTAHTLGWRVNLAYASAAWQAASSWRWSTMWIPCSTQPS
jgi:hypothetical protein